MHFTATTTTGPSPVIDPEAPSPLRRALAQASEDLANAQNVVDRIAVQIEHAERALSALRDNLAAALSERAVEQAAFDAIEAAVVAVEYDAEEGDE